MIDPGMRIAVAGMGRSGIAIATEARRSLALPTVFDEQAAETPAQFEAVERLQGQGIPVVTGWHGRLDPAEFDLLVASPGFRREHPAIRDMVRGGREVISEVEFAYRLAESPIVAITGTNGKSTTTTLTWLLIRAAGVEAVLCGNISGSGYEEVTLTEAAALGPGRILVAEVSSYQLEWVRDFRPKVAAITNVTPDHLDRHPSFEDYRATKQRLFAKMGEGDVVVANADEPSMPLESIEASVPAGVGLRLFSVGFGQDRDRGHEVEARTRVETEQLVLGGRRVARASLGDLSEHNAINMAMAWELATAALGTITDAQAEAMIGSLARFRGLEHRMEHLGTREGVTVINNSMCTNPRAVVSSLASRRERLHVLMGGMTKNLDFSPVAEFLERTAHRLYLIGRPEDDLVKQLGGLGNRFDSLEEAFDAAVSAAVSGEAIVFAPGCASAYPYSNFRERGEAFRAIAGAWLGQAKSSSFG